MRSVSGGRHDEPDWASHELAETRAELDRTLERIAELEAQDVWSSLKRSLANLTKQGIDQLAALIKTRLKPMLYRRGLIDGFLAMTGLDLTVP